jgi:CheY-like chemotaxis protein
VIAPPDRLLRILHVDDEPDMRDVVEISLGLDPGLATRSCGSGEEALVTAVDWQPDIILCDVMMPVMDGPATLMRLRENALTANIPVIFMTARAQTRELDRFCSLGALGVIPKPFDPMTLAASVRGYVQPAQDPLDDLRAGFLLRVKKDAAALSQDRMALKGGSRLPGTLDRIKRIAHGLSGAGGIYGFAELSDAAAALEDAAMAELADSGSGDETDLALDGLLFHAGNCGNSEGKMAWPLLQI